MTDQMAMGVEILALAELGKRVAARADAVRREFTATVTPGDRKTVRLTDGTKVGSVSYADPKPSARVLDERAFADWVADNFPDEVTPTVRPAFRKAVLDASAAAGVPMSPDGQVPPGVDVTDGRPYLTAKADPDGLPALLDAIRSNGLLALDGPGD